MLESNWNFLPPNWRQQRSPAAGKRRRAKRRHTPLFVEHLESRALLATAPDGLVSWYRAEGDATDSAGGNDGVLENGATFVAGKVGQAFLFDGVDDRVSVTDFDDSLEPGSGFTVEAWVNPSSSGHGRPIAEKRQGNANSYTFETTHSPFALNDGLQFVVWIGGVQQNFLQTPAGVLTNNTWQHVAATYNGMALRIFVDGVEKASSSVSGAIDMSAAPTAIGLNSIAAFAWHGALDEISFYNRGLTQPEIQGIVDAGSEGKEFAIVVTTAADEDDGSADPALGAGTSLREAIQRANASPGDDAIAFRIPGGGPHTISLLSELPAITRPVTIDGYTQPGASENTLTAGNDAVILVELDGADAGADASGLVLAGGASIVRGLAIGRFDGSGIRLLSDDNLIEGNFLGTDATGTQDRGNGEGVTIVGGEVDETAPLYSNDFESSVGEEWSSSVTSVTPVGNRRFLGQFGNETATLTLDADSIDQDQTTAITVEFDLFIVGTWEGNHAVVGPDRWILGLGNGMSLLDTTFNNGHFNSVLAGQAYPGVHGSGQFAALSGAAETNSLGYEFPDAGVEVMDSVYHLSFTFSYTGGDVVLNFAGIVTTPGFDESWGLDNVEVRAIASADSAPNDFSLASNPNGDWTYGWTSTLGGTLHPYPTAFTAANGIEGWIDNAIQQAGTPAVVYNPTAAPISSCCTIQPGQINFHPGPGGEQSVVRWTAPADELVDVVGFFVGIDGSPTTTDAHMLHNGASLFDGVVNRLYAGPYFETTLAVQAGDTIDFVVGVGGNGFTSDSTALDAVITRGVSPGPANGNVIGGTLPEAQNIIAYSGGDGIRTDGDEIEVVIVGNSIFANGADGIDIDDEIVDEPEIVSLTSFPGELRFDGSLDGEPTTTYRIEMFATSSGLPASDDEGQQLIGVRQVTTDESGHIAFIHELPPVIGPHWITATATQIDGDGETLLATSEFSDAVEINATAGADLAVTITDVPDPVFLGESVAYTVLVTNHGPAAATGVIVVASGPVGQPFNSVTIPIGGLASGASSWFVLAFTPTALGTFSATATVLAGEDDPNPANNSYTETTLVKSGVTFELAQAQYEVREGEEFAVLTVRRTGNLASGASVDFETLNGTAGQRGIREGIVRVDDFTTTSGTLFFKARSNVATIRVPIIDDKRLEPDETFRVVLSNPSGDAELGALSSSTVVIHDNDPTLSFFASSSERSEASGGRASIEVRLSPASNQTVTVSYAAGTVGSATAGVDYALIGRTLTFRPGETVKFIQFSTVNDTLFEGNETAFIELSSPINAFLGTQSRHRVTIVDNDPQPPPVDPGSTPATALFIDLQTLPRQAYSQFIARTELDVFKVELGPREHLALDVDPVALGGPLPNSRLTIFDSDGLTVLVTVGASFEPEGGQTTNNAATMFQADADGGVYYVQLSTTATGRSYGYSLGFHRIGVAENVPTPEQLNVPGPMFAWYEPTATPGTSIVGITGPTGYGFTLEGPWQQQVPAFGRSALRSQTLTMPFGSHFIMHSPQGFDVPLIAEGLISFATKPRRWGDIVGEVNANAINFPVSLDASPVNGFLADLFGSDILQVGLLAGNWRISLGGKVLFADGRNTNSEILPLLGGVPYLRQRGPINVTAHLGPFALSYPVVDKPIDWAFDPADPMLYIQGPQVGEIRKPTLAVSLHGLLEYKPQDAPAPEVEAGVTEFYGHILGSATVPFKIGPVPFKVDAEYLLSIDADRDGLPLGDLADIDDLMDVLEGDFSEAEEILSDVQIGANGKLLLDFDKFPIELGRASVVLNGLEETIWVRGQQGGVNPLAGTPLEDFNLGTQTLVVEGMINWDGDFLLSTTTSYDTGNIDFEYGIKITNDGITAHIKGEAKFSATIDLGNLGSASGTATAEIEGTLRIDIDDHGNPHLSGSITAIGKLKARGRTVFSGSIDALVRDKGFRFKFPRGVGNIDLNLF